MEKDKVSSEDLQKLEKEFNEKKNRFRPENTHKAKTKFDLFKSNQQNLYRPEYVEDEINDNMNEKIWELMGKYQGRDAESIQKSIVAHVEYTLAMTRFDFSNFGCAQACAYSLRDRTIESWNDTNLFLKHQNAKCVYIFSMEYQLERLLKSQLMNNDLEGAYRDALKDIGYDLEDVYEEEVEFNLGSGLCGRIVGEYLDSLATLNIPSWAYGLRYEYGMFQQEIGDQGEVIEIPNYWLEKGNPWEIERAEIMYKVQLGGESNINHISKEVEWLSEDTIQAVAYDIPLTGFNTFNTNNLRLWRSRPYFGDQENEEEESDEDLVAKIDKIQDAEYLTSIYYPSIPSQEHKAERLKQEYFYASATLQDLMRRFKKDIMCQMNEFHDKNQILLNELHSAISILEMLRILVDEEKLVWQQAWNTAHYTFSCAIYVTTHHNLEQWPVTTFQKVLPRHFQLIQNIDKLLIQQITKTFANRCTPEEIRRKIDLMTLIDTKQGIIRLANLCFVSCNKVIFCSELQRDILLQEENSPLKEYYSFLNKSFILIEPGVNPRKWIHKCNRELSALITDVVEDESEWLTHLQLLRPLMGQIQEYKRNKSDPNTFFARFMKIRHQHKQRLVQFIRNEREEPDFLQGFDVEKTLFDGCLKRISQSARHILLFLFVIQRYQYLKTLSLTEKSKVVPRVVLVGGVSRPGSTLFLQLIKYINVVSKIMDNDPETNTLLKLVFLPNFNNTNEYLYVPALDVNEQMTLPGKQACATQVLKYVMNGSLVVGSRDATNLRIERTLGENVCLLFGKNYFEHQSTTSQKSEALRSTIRSLVENKAFGSIDGELADYLTSIGNNKDDGHVQDDFDSYCAAQQKADDIFKDQSELCRRSITSLAKCGDLSCDQSVVSYCQSVWNVKSVEVPNPSLNPGHRVRSHSHLHMQENGSIERGDDSYHSNMFNMEDQVRGAVGDHSSHESKELDTPNKLK